MRSQDTHTEPLFLRYALVAKRQLLLRSPRGGTAAHQRTHGHHPLRQAFHTSITDTCADGNSQPRALARHPAPSTTRFRQRDPPTSTRPAWRTAASIAIAPQKPSTSIHSLRAGFSAVSLARSFAAFFSARAVTSAATARRPRDGQCGRAAPGGARLGDVRAGALASGSRARAPIFCLLTPRRLAVQWGPFRQRRCLPRSQRSHCLFEGPSRCEPTTCLPPRSFARTRLPFSRLDLRASTKQWSHARHA